MFRRSNRPSSGHVARCAPEARPCPRLRAIQRRPASTICAAVTASARTHYEVLGVRDSASVRDIKDAFRRLALLWHPDRYKQPGAKDKFMELKTAYDTLVDFSARAKYDLQLKQAAHPPPVGPAAAAYDGYKPRGGASVRRSSRTFRKAPQKPTDGFAAAAAAPPRPPTASSFSGDDFEAFTARASSGASGAGAGTSTPQAAGAAGFQAASTSTSSPIPGRTASAQGHTQRASSTAGGTNRSIHLQEHPPTGASSLRPWPPGMRNEGSRGSASGSGSSGASSIFGGSTATPAANQQAARSTSAFSRSSSRPASRSSRRSRYAQSGSSSSAGSSRPASPTPAQQWHTMYCHSGDDFVSATGTSYAATAAYTRVTAHSRGRDNAGGSGTIGCGSRGERAGGGGLSLRSPSPAEEDVRALPAPENPVPTWPSSASRIASGDDYVPHQPALAGIARRESLPVPAPPAWNHAQARSGPARAEAERLESSPRAASPAWDHGPAQPAAVRSHERREVQPVRAPPMWDVLSTLLPLRM